MRLLGIILIFLIRVMPRVFQLIIWAMWQSVKFFTTWWVGLPIAVDRTVDLWMERLHRGGMTMELDSFVEPLVRVLAYISFIAGWILYAHITVWIFHRIF